MITKMSTVQGRIKTDLGAQAATRALPLLLGITLGWGINWPITKLVLAEVPPLTLRGIGLLCGGLGILGIARVQGHSLSVATERLPQVLWLALFNSIGFHVLAAYGLSYLPPGRAALLAYSMPLWCLPLSVFVLGETVTSRRVLALTLGLIGVGFLLAGSFTGMASAPLGTLLMLLSAWSWATGIVLLRRWQVPVQTSVLTGWLLVIGATPVLLLAAVIDGIPQRWPSGTAISGLLYNVVVAFMLCNWAWNRLVLLVPVATSSLSSLFTPIVSIAAGAVVFRQRPGWGEFIATTLILCALVMMLQNPATVHRGRN